MTPAPPHVVLAASDARESGVLTWLLREHGFDVSVIPLAELPRRSLRPKPDLLLLDHDGGAIEELLRRVRAEDHGRRTPVILLGVNRPDEAARALRLGADDWVAKPLVVSDLLARIGARMHERADATQTRDVLARREEELERALNDNRRLEELATTDALTRLLNRRALMERLAGEVERARRFKSQLSVLVMDLDHFKSVNDQHGHLIGDEILRRIGALLTSVVRAIDVVARYGGEEFVIVLPETSSDGAVVFAERLRERISATSFGLAAAPDFHLTCSVGVATFPSPHVASPEDLFARADEALYRAKSGGRDQVRI